MTNIPIEELDYQGSVLFLGSGFSAGATNIRGRQLPTGAGLKSELARLLKVSPEAYDLKTLADEVYRRKELNLYQTLYELFTVKELSSDQERILKEPWRRIYTTNFDDAVELAFHKSSRTIHSYSYSDHRPKKILPSTIVHLHGAIRSTNEDNVLDQLVLNEASYVRRHFEESEWFDEFQRDLRFCTNCFFVGYSLADYHITALLMQNPETRGRTYFITAKKNDPIYISQTEAYGTVLPIETIGFAELCEELPRRQALDDPSKLTAFRYVNPYKDKQTLAAPSALEIRNLVTYGTFNFQRCLSTLPNADYVIPRTTLVDRL